MRVRRAAGSTFERLYSVVVLVKGIDGALELIAGATLLLVPGAVRSMLLTIAAELAEGSSALRTAAASVVTTAGHDVSSVGLAFAAFLVVHGVVKLGTVWCLLRRATRWYPAAIGVLAVLFVVQTVDAVGAPSAGAWLLAVADVVVVALVGWEYHRLRRRAVGTAGRAVEAVQPDRQPEPSRR